jgi:sugar lactone lactonase YvrE
MTQQTFECPNCKGPIEYTSGMGKTITCRFCGTSVVVPKDLRTAEYQQVPRNMVQQQPMIINVDPEMYKGAATAAAASSGISGCIGLLITLVIIVFVFGIILLTAGGSLVAAFLPALSGSSSTSGTTTGSDSSTTGGLGSIIPQINVTAAPTDVPFAALTLTFGDEGTGPGFFKDARHIAVDGAGNIYVGGYNEDRRVQAFDPNGTFITQWTVSGDTPVRGLAATRDGTVYVTTGGKAYKYQGATGTLLGTFEPQGASAYFDTIALTADGSLVFTTFGSPDDIYFYDAQGNFRSKIDAAVSTASGEFGESADQIAIDGVGNLYALPVFDESVYKFGPDGRFVDKFTGPNKEVNNVEFTSPYDLAVDNQSRIYLTDFDGIIVLDSNGNYLRTIDDGGNICYGISFDYEGNLWIAAYTKVLKFTIYK